MHPLHAFVATTATHLPVVAPRGVGLNGGLHPGIGASVENWKFVAPPAEIANLTLCCIFLFVNLIQFIIVLSAFSRGRPGVRLPAVYAAIALAVLTAANVLGISSVVGNFTMDGPARPRPFPRSVPYTNLLVASALFYEWSDPAMFAAVALVLYGRFYSVQKSSSSTLIALAITAGMFFTTMIVFITVSTMMYHAIFAGLVDNSISRDDADRRTHAANNVFYAYVALHIFGTLFLALLSFLVKTRTKKDIVTSLILYAIMPLLFLHALARLIFTILQARLLLSHSFTESTVNALDLAGTFVNGLLYAAATSVLTFLLAHARLWDPATVADHTMAPSNYLVQPVLQIQIPRDIQAPDPEHYSPQYVYSPPYSPQDYLAREREIWRASQVAQISPHTPDFPATLT